MATAEARRRANQAYAERHRDDPVRKAKMREYRRNWKQRHREQSNALEVRRQNERYATDPEYRARVKMRQRLRRYGLSYEQYVEMFSRQNGRCAVCRCELVLDGRHTHIDHSHDTDQLRELLCHGCNTALGLLDEDPSRVRALADYVERHQRTGGDANER